MINEALNENYKIRKYNNNDNDNNITNEVITNDASVLINISASIDINNKTTTFDLFKGLFFMFISCLFKSIFSILSKFVLYNNSNLNSFVLLVAKVYIMIVISIFAVVYYAMFDNINKLAPSKKDFNKVVLRSLLSIICISIIIFSLNILSISDVFSIYYIYPGIVMLFSLLILKEKTTKIDYICLLACIIGVLLIIRPAFVSKYLFYLPEKDEKNYNNLQKPNNYIKIKNNPIYNLSKLFVVCLVIIASISKAIEDIIIKSIGSYVEAILYPIVYSFLGIIMYPLFVIMFRFNISSLLNLDFTTYIILIVIAISSYLMQFFMAKSFQKESASRASMVNYLQLIFMFLSDLVLFNHKFYLVDLIGTFLIFGFNFANGVYKFLDRLERKENSHSKQY